MHSLTYALLAALVAYAAAGPVISKRAVVELNEAAFEEAQQRDAAATRAFSNVQIKVCSTNMYRDEFFPDQPRAIDLGWQMPIRRQVIR